MLALKKKSLVTHIVNVSVVSLDRNHPQTGSWGSATAAARRTECIQIIQDGSQGGIQYFPVCLHASLASVYRLQGDHSIVDVWERWKEYHIISKIIISFFNSTVLFWYFQKSQNTSNTCQLSVKAIV